MAVVAAEFANARVKDDMAVSWGRSPLAGAPPNRPGADCNTCCLWWCDDGWLYHDDDPAPREEEPPVDPELAGSKPGMLALDE